MVLEKSKCFLESYTLNGNPEITTEALAEAIAAENYFDEVMICDSALQTSGVPKQESALSKEAVNELFREISQKVANREGGYTRILRTGIRQGDNAEMCIIELVDYNENMLKDVAKKKAKTTRRGRSKKETVGVEVPAAKKSETAEVKPVEQETIGSEADVPNVEPVAEDTDQTPEASTDEKAE